MMIANKKVVALLVCWICLFSGFFNQAVSKKAVKNVIFYIGDGMGISQIVAARIFMQGAEGLSRIEKMPVTGFMTTHTIDQLITDSAAGATAMATGYKTRNGMVGFSPDSLPLYSIMEAAHDKGLSTGLIVTCSITHATPACFAAHVPSRRQQDVIAVQLIESGLSLMLGGGKGFFIPQQENGSKRLDGRNLLEEADARGYSLVENKNQLAAVSKLPVIGLFSMSDLGAQPMEPTLAEMTAKSLELLQTNNKGFFLMVEGSQIDWAGHENDFQYLVREMAAFDEAVGEGLKFAQKNKNTLVLVTADHETGGLIIAGGKNDGKDIKVAWHSTAHSGTPVPLFAAGARSELFSGVKDNTEIPLILGKLLGLKNFPSKALP